jgi:NADH-quinone oxidoreductase subunit M
MFNELSVYGQLDWPLLSTLIWFPIIAAIALRYFNKIDNAYVFTMFVLVVELWLCGAIILYYTPDAADIQFVEQFNLWIGLNYSLGIDGISLLFVPWAVLITFLLVLYIYLANKNKVEVKYFSYVLFCLGCKLGALLSMDLLLFWIFITAEIYPISRLISRFGKGEQCKEASRRYSSSMIAASIAMLIGFAILANQTSTGDNSFSYISLFNKPISENIQYAVFPILFFAFIFRAPLFPFHTWMLKVINQGPVLTMGVFLIGINTAVYGLIRLTPLFIDAIDEFYIIGALICLASVIYGSLIALVQSNLFRLLSYGTIAHLGVIVMAIFSLNSFGLYGSMLGALSLFITTVGLFFISSFINNRINSLEINNNHYSLFRTAPLLTVSFIALVIGNIGFPGTLGFNAEHTIILGALSGNWLMLITVVLAALLSAGYFLMYFKRTLLDNRLADSGDIQKFADLKLREALIMLVFLVLVYVNGLFEPYIELGSIDTISSRFESLVHSFNK